MLAAPPAGTASTILVTALGQGWMTSSSSNGDSPSNNFIAGNCGAGDCYAGEFRNFFQFAVPTLDGPVISAALVLDTGYVALGQAPDAVYQVTSVPDLFGFNDLGTGTVYGSQAYTGSNQNMGESIALNSAALAAIQAAAGAVFQVGGRISSAADFGSGQPDELVFGRTDAAQELEIVTASGSTPAPLAGPEMLLDSLSTDPSAPEPATGVLVGVVLVAGGLTLRRIR
jgi:hypothetical protein